MKIWAFNNFFDSFITVTYQIESRCDKGLDGCTAPIFTISTLVCRRDEPMYQVFARSLIENISVKGTDISPILIVLYLIIFETLKFYFPSLLRRFKTITFVSQFKR